MSMSDLPELLNLAIIKGLKIFNFARHAFIAMSIFKSLVTVGVCPKTV